MFKCIKKWLCTPFKKQVTHVFDDTDPNFDYVDYQFKSIKYQLNKEICLRKQLFAHLGYTNHGGTVMTTKDAQKYKGITPYDPKDYE